MANSTYLQICNRVAVLTGQTAMGSSSGDFNSNTLDKPQQQIKEVVNYANAELALVERGRFMRRVYTLAVGPDTNVYAISWQTSFERLVEDSWRIVSPIVQGIDWLSFQSFRLRPEVVASIPFHWVPLTDIARVENPDSHLFAHITDVTVGTTTVLELDVNERAVGEIIFVQDITGTAGSDVLNGNYFRILAVDDLTITIDADTTGKVYTSGGAIFVNAADRVSFYPAPASAMTIEYEGYLDSAELANEDDPIIWPKKIEHLLIAFAVEIMEGLLGEGKDLNWQSKLEPYLTQVRQLTMGPVEDTPGLDLGIEICSFDSPRRRQRQTEI